MPSISFKIEKLTYILKRIKKKINNPIIILGGFLITPEAYEITKNTIKFITKREVEVVNISKKDWIKTNSIHGWTKILNKVDQCVKDILKTTTSEKVDLIGHSSGGIMLRQYLSDEKFNGKLYNGKSFTSNLVTLGSPHQAIKATKLRKSVDEKYPGNFFKETNYISVGGEIEISSDQTSLITKIFAKSFYKSISGNKNERGDGLVPLSSSLLTGSQKIILSNTAHGKIFGKEWYGSSSKIEEWLSRINWK